MNKIVKAIIAILGATELIFSAMIPIAVALLILPLVESQIAQNALITAGLISTLYRGLKVWLIG